MTVIFTDDVDVAEVDKVPGQYRELFVHQMVANGEGELSAGDTYVDSFYPVARTQTSGTSVCSSAWKSTISAASHARTHKLV